jgi:hypothetical protein
MFIGCPGEMSPRPYKTLRVRVFARETTLISHLLKDTRTSSVGKGSVFADGDVNGGRLLPFGHAA